MAVFSKNTDYIFLSTANTQLKLAGFQVKTSIRYQMGGCLILNLGRILRLNKVAGACKPAGKVRTVNLELKFHSLSLLKDVNLHFRP